MKSPDGYYGKLLEREITCFNNYHSFLNNLRKQIDDNDSFLLYDFTVMEHSFSQSILKTERIRQAFLRDCVNNGIVPDDSGKTAVLERLREHCRILLTELKTVLRTEMKRIKTELSQLKLPAGNGYGYREVKPSMIDILS